MLRLILLLILLPWPAISAPKIVADIAPVHSLVARVMQGVGSPAMVVPQGASPHHLSMKSSDARVLEEAALVFWIGPDLTPWLERPLAVLSGGRKVALLEVAGTIGREVREGPLFSGHDHGDGSAGHGPDEPHAWLDPENAKVWLAAIAAELSAIDPENAGLYRENAQAGAVEIDAAIADASEMLASLRGARFVVFHDGYLHFEERFGLAATAAIASGDAARPGAARLMRLRTVLAASPKACVFREPRTPEKALLPITEGMDVRIGVLDPMGDGLETGPALYPALIRAMAVAMRGCLMQ